MMEFLAGCVVGGMGVLVFVCWLVGNVARYLEEEAERERRLLYAER
jgi:hypothetical protein